MRPNFISLTDKNGYNYPFASISMENINQVKFNKAELDYTFALVTLSNGAIKEKLLLGKVNLLAELPTKLEQEIKDLKPTHLLIYHSYADSYTIDKDKLSDFGFTKVWF